MRIKALFTAALFMTLFTVSCSDDDDNGGGGSSDDKFSCTIDGASYDISGQYAWADFVGSGNDLFAVYGSEDQTQSGFSNVFISFEGGKPTVGTHEMGLGKKALATWIDTGSGSTFISGLPGGSGSVEVTEITDSRIKGTFSAVIANADGATKKLENGSFDVRIGF